MLFYRKISLTTMVSISFIVGIIASLYAYFKSHDVIKKKENKLNIVQKIKLYVIRTIHYAISFLARIYPFMVEISMFNEIFVLCAFFILLLHWKYFGECIMSIEEKKMLDSRYIGGSEPKYEPFWVLLNDSPVFYDFMQNFAVVSLALIGIRLLYVIFSRPISKK